MPGRSKLPKRAIKGARAYKIREIKTGKKVRNEDAINYSLTVPGEFMRRLSTEDHYVAELRPEGLLFRPVDLGEFLEAQKAAEEKAAAAETPPAPPWADPALVNGAPKQSISILRKRPGS